jgi:xylose dehydrogenase (NAD/NADP)
MAGSDVVRWGILGPGGIAAKLVAEAPGASSARVVACASRDRSRAAAFAGRFGIPTVHEDYEALLSDPGVDAVYIATPNSAHHPMTLRALEAGKHVLAEKPYTRTPSEVEEAFDLAESRGLILMEAFMWRHTPHIKRFMELLPEIGELQSIRATFSFVMTNERDIRLVPELAGGALMDVGCYCVSGSRLVAGEEPELVFGEQHLGPSGVDDVFSGLLRFRSGLVGEIVCGFTSHHRELEAIGVKGNMLLNDPWLGQDGGIVMSGEGWRRELPQPPADRYGLELENMSAAILGRGRPLLGRADALGQARTIEALYRSAATGGPVALV